VGYKVALLIRYQDDLIRKSLSSPPPKNTLLLKKRFLQKLKASQPILAAPPAPEPGGYFQFLNLSKFGVVTIFG
jgi:hypothetical protein